MLTNLAADEQGNGFSALMATAAPTTEQRLALLESHIARIRRNMVA